MKFLGELVFGLVFEIVGEIVGGALGAAVDSVRGPTVKKAVPDEPESSFISLNLSE